MDIDKTFSIDNGIIFDEENGGPYIVGGTASPIGVDLPTKTLYLQSSGSEEVEIWFKYGSLVTEWKKITNEFGKFKYKLDADLIIDDEYSLNAAECIEANEHDIVLNGDAILEVN